MTLRRDGRARRSMGQAARDSQGDRRADGQGNDSRMRRGETVSGARILVLNAGSSSIKVSVFERTGAAVMSGLAEGIGAPSGRLKIDGETRPAPLDDHRAALTSVLEALSAAGCPVTDLAAAAHRVVHGGRELTAAARVTDAVATEIEHCIPLAPLHNPHSLAAIRTLSEIAPELPQYASFDTAFHATVPEVAARYALPPEAERLGIRRYGFHGLSYAALTQHLPRISGAPLPARVLALHLGNGASMCAIHEGRSVATTMGYSPLSGLTMGTRPGDLDANAVLRLAREHGLENTVHLLNRESGLRGLSRGKSDMRALLADDSADSAFAVEHFCYWACRHAGSLIAAMGGLDAVAFTGGIGEHAAPVRARIARGLGWLGLELDEEANREARPQLHAGGSKIGAWIVPAQEERQIAAEARALMDAEA